MATHKSAIKEHRQSLVRRERNRFKRARMRSAIKLLRQQIADGKSDEAKAALSGVLSLVDRTARHGAIEPNAASRYKSRLTLAVNKL